MICLAPDLGMLVIHVPEGLRPARGISSGARG
jgi:hypothetical protein